MEATIKVPLRERINPRIIVFTLVVLTLVGVPAYWFIEEAITGGIIDRGDYKGLVKFGNEDSGRNLPHGVIVDNIGLNGVLIPRDDNQRDIFLTCARWVKPMDRLCYAIEQNAGRQTSRPLLLKVRKAPSQTATR